MAKLHDFKHADVGYSSNSNSLVLNMVLIHSLDGTKIE